VLGRSLDAVDGAIARICGELGPLAFVSEPRPFAWTSYYRQELGRAPARRFIALERLEDPSRLPELKRASARLEVATARPGEGRQVNIDPGLLNAEQLVLASTKPRRHRIYMGRGVFADLMLLFDGERCTPLPWTYPDYAQEARGRLMLQLRGLYLSLLRERCPEGGRG
jgi:hypothetical protein